MEVDKFLDLLEAELKQNPKLAEYHRLVNDEQRYKFRKSYIKQRYTYFTTHIKGEGTSVFDVGCGYGTPAILLASQGHKVYGNTLEYYTDGIADRFEYWGKYIDLSNLVIDHKDLFDIDPQEQTRFDYILAMDALHHIEPIGTAATVLYDLLADGGSLVVCEENGNNLFNRVKNFRQRGFRRIVKYYDEKLQKELLFGNENTRSLKKWARAFAHTPFVINRDSVEYIRFYMPSRHNRSSEEELLRAEERLWKRNPFLKHFFFFGINFIMDKQG